MKENENQKKSPRKGADKVSNMLLQLPHRSVWILGGVVVFMLWAFFTGNKSLFKLYKLNKLRNKIYQEKVMLEAENKRLLNDIERLQNDMERIEKVAREKYNLKRTDETVYEILPQ